MDRPQFTMVRSRTPDRNPETLFQIVAATNHRLTILGMDIGIQGNTPATSPIVFDWVIQTTSGTPGTSPTTLTAQKKDRGYDEASTATLTAFDGTGPAEPAGTTKICELSIHEQGTFSWRPPFPFVVEGGTPERLGFRHTGTNYNALSITLYWEE